MLLVIPHTPLLSSLQELIKFISEFRARKKPPKGTEPEGPMQAAAPAPGLPTSFPTPDLPSAEATWSDFQT